MRTKGAVWKDCSAFNHNGDRCWMVLFFNGIKYITKLIWLVRHITDLLGCARKVQRGLMFKLLCAGPQCLFNCWCWNPCKTNKGEGGDGGDRYNNIFYLIQFHTAFFQSRLLGLFLNIKAKYVHFLGLIHSLSIHCSVDLFWDTLYK